MPPAAVIHRDSRRRCAVRGSAGAQAMARKAAVDFCDGEFVAAETICPAYRMQPPAPLLVLPPSCGTSARPPAGASLLPPRHAIHAAATPAEIHFASRSSCRHYFTLLSPVSRCRAKPPFSVCRWIREEPLIQRAVFTPFRAPLERRYAFTYQALILLVEPEYGRPQSHVKRSTMPVTLMNPQRNTMAPCFSPPAVMTRCRRHTPSRHDCR